jgi:hypothetical protein
MGGQRMRVRLEGMNDGDTLFLPLPDELLEQLGWLEGDELIVDISMTDSNVMIIHRKEKQTNESK